MAYTARERAIIFALLQKEGQRVGPTWLIETTSEPDYLRVESKRLVNERRLALDQQITDHATTAANELAALTSERDFLVALEAKMP